MADLLSIGNAIRDGYASSIADGQAAWRDHIADGMRVYHVPELPGDGTPVTAAIVKSAGASEIEALGKLGTRIAVESVRQVDDDTLILDCTFTGILPGGAPFRFSNVLIYSFTDGMLTRLIEVASAEMWSTLQQALRAVS